MSVLYCADARRAPAWAGYFAAHAPAIAFHTWPGDPGDLAQVEYVIAWQADAGLLARLPNLKVFFASGAGIDHLDFSAIPPHVPVVRMVEPGIINGMLEYVTLAVLSLHRNLHEYAAQQALRNWQPIPVTPASARRIGVLGLGVLGQAVLERLGVFGYQRLGWNRSPRGLPGVSTYAGAGELPAFLGQCDVLVCLLPLTESTRGMLGRELFAMLPPGAALVNVGRGGHLDQRALLDALDSGHLSRAILDVTDPEPLPADDPLWRHPRVTITPHVASMTQPETAAPVLLENLLRHQAGKPLRDVVDRGRGY
jgi:glyoxylate/hydroxypyruvate reductase A